MRIGDVVFTGVYRYREDKLQWRWGKLRIQWRPVSAWKPTPWRRQMWVLVYHILLVSFAKSPSIRLSVLKMSCLLTDDCSDRENCELSNPSVYHFSQNSMHSSKVMTSGPAFFVDNWALSWCYMLYGNKSIALIVSGRYGRSWRPWRPYGNQTFLVELSV